MSDQKKLLKSLLLGCCLGMSAELFCAAEFGEEAAGKIATELLEVGATDTAANTIDAAASRAAVTQGVDTVAAGVDNAFMEHGPVLAGVDEAGLDNVLLEDTLTQASDVEVVDAMKNKGSDVVEADLETQASEVAATTSEAEVKLATKGMSKMAVAEALTDLRALGDMRMGFAAEKDAIFEARGALADTGIAMKAGRNAFRVAMTEVSADAQGAMARAVDNQSVLGDVEKVAESQAKKIARKAASKVLSGAQKAFSKLTPDQQAAVVARSGLQDADAVNQALKGFEEGGTDAVSNEAKAAVKAIDAQGAFRSLGKLGEYLDKAGASAIRSNLEGGLEKAFAGDLSKAGVQDAMAGFKEDLTAHMAQLDESAQAQLGKLRAAGAIDTADAAAKDFAQAQDSFKEMMQDPEKMDEMETARGKLRKLGRAIWSKIKGAGNFAFQQLVMAGVMMGPGIAQSMIQAEAQLKAQLEQLAAPILWGGLVLQIPDSCVNVDNPGASLKLYVALPTSSTSVLTEACQAVGITQLNSAKYPGNLASMSSAEISRFYGTDPVKMAQFYQSAQWYVSYPADGFSAWGQSAITDPDFPGYLINLNSGMVLASDGTSAGKAAMPLVNQPLVQAQSSGAAPTSVAQFLTQMLSKIESFGATKDFNSGSDYSPVSVQSIGHAIKNMFDARCIDTAQQLSASSLAQLCVTEDSAKSPTCLLQSGLKNCNAELFLDGVLQVVDQVMVTSCCQAKFTQEQVQNLADSSVQKVVYTLQQSGKYKADEHGVIYVPIDEVQQVIVQGGTFGSVTLVGGGLGSVKPFCGAGQSFSTEYIASLSAGVRQALLAGDIDSHVLQALKVADMPPLTKSSAQALVGAAPDNYIAKGLYIYKTKNSNMCRMLQPTISSTQAAALHDYIVFLDGDLNIVPLLVPQLVQKETVNAMQQTQSVMYYDVSWVLNPAIVCYASLISTFDPTFNFAPNGSQLTVPVLFAKQVAAGQMYDLACPTGFMNSPQGNVAIGSPVLSTFIQTASGHDFSREAIKQISYEMAGALQTLYAGPFKFGTIFLEPAGPSYNFSFSANGTPINVVVYKGYACYPVPAGEGAATGVGSDYYTDLLIPWSGQFSLNNPSGGPVILPTNASAPVTQFLGLVTDILYSVDPKTGQIIPDPKSGFSNAEVTVDPQGAIQLSSDIKKYGVYSFLNFFSNYGASYASNSSNSLVVGTQTYRSNWITWISNITANSSMPGATVVSSTALDQKEFAGIPFGSMILQVAGSVQLRSGLYLYSAYPNPSDIPADMYLLASRQTSATSSSLGAISALTATDSMVLVSLASGLMYDSTGAVVKDPNSGVVQSVSPMALQATLQSKYGQAYKPLLPAIEQLNALWAQKASTIRSPYMFGTQTLGIYEIDLMNGNYIYFDMKGATDSHFVPTDYFVTMVDPSKGQINASTVGQALNAQTAYIISLVTGRVYNTTGVYGDIPSTQAIFNVVSLGMDRKRAQQIQNAISLYQASLKAEQREDADAKNIGTIEQGHIEWSQAQVQAIIARMQSIYQNSAGSGTGAQSELYNLLYVRLFDLLVYDPQTKLYALAVSTNVSGQNGQSTSAQLFTFFNVPNTYKTAEGKPALVGAIYTGAGEFVRLVTGAELTSLKYMYGVYVDPVTFEQKLTIVANQPPLPMTDKDVTLTPGQSGQYLIAASDVKPLTGQVKEGYTYFPTRNIPSKVVGSVQTGDQNAQYYFYYHNVMKAYYVLVLQGEQRKWVAIATGNAYDTKGQALTEKYTCAGRVNSSDGSINMNDLFLPYQGNGGFLQGYMRNPYADSNVSVPLDQAVGSYFQFGNYAVVNYQKNPQTGALTHYLDKTEPFSHYEPYKVFKNGSKNMALNQMFTSEPPTAQVPVAQLPGPLLNASYPVADVHELEKLYVYWSTVNPHIYTRLAGYEMQILTYLPIDMQGTRSVVNVADSLNPIFQSPVVVWHNGSIEYCLFGVRMYKASGQGSTSFVDVDNSAYTLTVQINTDELTSQQYITLIGIPNPLLSGQTPGTYHFQYIYTLPDNSYNNSWQVTQSADAWGNVQLISWIAQNSNGLNLLPVSFTTGATSTSVAISIPSLLTGAGFAASSSAISQFTDVVTMYGLNQSNLFYDQGQSFSGSSVQNSRYLYKLDPAQSNQTQAWPDIFTIISNSMFVDLATGVLIDAYYGVPVGMSLPVGMFVSLLDSLCISVQYADNGSAELLYRSAGVINKQDAKIASQEMHQVVA